MSRKARLFWRCLQAVVGLWNAYTMISCLDQGNYVFAAMSGAIVLMTASWRFQPAEQEDK